MTLKQFIAQVIAINFVVSVCCFYRSSHRRCSVGKGVLRDFEKFTGKHLCQSLFFNKVASNFSKKETLTQVFSSEFCEILKEDLFFTKHLWWLLAYLPNKYKYKDSLTSKIIKVI